MDSATKALLVLGVVIILFIWNRLPVTVVGVLTALGLWATGLVTTEEAVGGFGDPVVVFVGTLFIISEAIDSTGVTTWAGQAMLAKAGTSYRRLFISLAVLAAVLTSFITLNGSAAALLPLVIVVAHRIGKSPSQMLMPVIFAGSCGGVFMLMSSTVNVIVSEAAEDAGAGPIPFFAFALAGIPLLIGTVALGWYLGPRVLPQVTPVDAPPDLGRHAETIEAHYRLTDGFYRLRVRSRSDLVGASTDDLASDRYPDIQIIGVEKPQGGQITDVIADDDILVVNGPSSQVSRLVVERGLAVNMTGSADAEDLLTREAGVAEVIIPPRSRLVGEEAYPGQKRDHELVILAIQRRGRDIGEGPIPLAEGDAILVHGRWSALEQLSRDRDVLLVDSPRSVRRQTVPWGPKATRAIIVLGLLVAMLASGLIPPAIAGLIAALLMIGARVLTVPQALRAVSWQTVVLIGSLIPLSVAIRTSGAADKIADVIIAIVGEGQPYLLLVAVFLLTALLGQVVSNTATTLVVAPIAVAAAVHANMSVLPVLMVVAVAGSAALLTPIATPGNLMVMKPGGYEFGDYWKLGLPVMGWWFIVAMTVVPLVWGV